MATATATATAMAMVGMVVGEEVASSSSPAVAPSDWIAWSTANASPALVLSSSSSGGAASSSSTASSPTISSPSPSPSPSSPASTNTSTTASPSPLLLSPSPVLMMATNSPLIQTELKDSSCDEDSDSGGDTITGGHNSCSALSSENKDPMDTDIAAQTPENVLLPTTDCAAVALAEESPTVPMTDTQSPLLPSNTIPAITPPTTTTTTTTTTTAVPVKPANETGPGGIIDGVRYRPGGNVIIYDNHPSGSVPVTTSLFGASQNTNPPLNGGEGRSEVPPTVASETTKETPYYKVTYTNKGCSVCMCQRFEAIEHVTVRCNSCFHMRKVHTINRRAFVANTGSQCVTISSSPIKHGRISLNLDLNGEKPLDKRDERDKIALEILLTERSYLDSLQTLLEVFVIPLRSTPEPLIPLQKLSIIFAYLPELLQLNTILLSGLEERMQKWDKTKELADIFLRLSPFFIIYENYASTYDFASATLEECEKNFPNFTAFLKAQLGNSLCRGHSLKSLLSLPLQRCNNYHLMLQGLLATSVPDHPDFANLQAVVEKLKIVNDHIEEFSRLHQKKKKVADLQRRLNMSNYNINLVEPHRIFVREGMLSKVCRKTIKKRMFYLFSDILMYGKIVTNEFIFSRVLTLDNLRVDDLPDTDKQTNAFQISSSQKSFIVCSDTKYDKMAWVLDLFTTAQRLQGQKANLSVIAREIANTIPSPTEPVTTSASPPPEFEAPVWQSDSEAPNCNLCEGEFTLFNRRHHCRLCGKVVCGTCSLRRVVVPHLSESDRQRVCDYCWMNKLVKKNSSF
ncbi:protein piccolo [Pelomyxa schiedti]|nr:protein piccolo [Pelomyxa schiedti]